MYRVIAVDDEPWALSSLLDAYEWEKNNFKIVYRTCDPFQAMEEIIRQQPELAFVDIRIGGMDGLTLIQRCRQQGCRTIFVIVSAYEEFEYAKTAISLGVFEYLLKPIDEGALSMCMDKARELLSASAKSPLPETVPEEAQNSGGFEKLLSYVNSHFNEEITLSTLSEIFFYRQTYICDLFRTRMGTTLSEYLNNIRLKEAYHLITKQGVTASYAAELVGYSNYSYFCRLFKAKFGVPPTRISRSAASPGKSAKNS